MSHAASHYVKHLVSAPNGERITAVEKGVLTQLADDHREEVGFAWPSVGSLARRACLSERQCRRVLAEIERKGVIVRLPTAREKDLGQSSNEYVFCQLDPPAIVGRALADMRLKLQKTPRSRMTGGGGHLRPGPPVTDDRAPRTPATGTPGHVCPPIDPLRDSSEDRLSILPSEPGHPLPLPQAEGARGRSKAGKFKPFDAARVRERFGCGEARAAALASVMSAVGESTEGLADALWAQFELEPQGDGRQLAEAMKQAWQRYLKLGYMLRFRWGPKKFFGHNHWRSEGGWPFDAEMLKQYRNASVGS